MRSMIRALSALALACVFGCSAEALDATEMDEASGDSSDSLSAVEAAVVAWQETDGSTNVNLGTIDYGTAIDMGLFYTVSGVSGSSFVLKLAETDNGDKSTKVLQRPAKNGSNGIRPGYDISNYQLGANQFVYTLMLQKGTAVVSKSTFTVTFVVK